MPSELVFVLAFQKNANMKNKMKPILIKMSNY